MILLRLILSKQGHLLSVDLTKSRGGIIISFIFQERGREVIEIYVRTNSVWKGKNSADFYDCDIMWWGVILPVMVGSDVGGEER